MKMSFLRVLIVCALGAIASTTQAGLTHVDDDTFAALVSQPFEVTRDSATNLDWLDIDAYNNTSWTNMNLLLGNGILADWRHATSAEVGVYFGNLGLETGNYPNTTADSDGGVRGNAAIAYTGTFIPDFASTYVYGTTATLHPPQPNNYKAAYFWFGTDRSTTSVGNVHESTSENWLGHWLVRTSPEVVPEPSTFSMLAFGCIAMAGYTRLRRRRK